MPVLNLEYIYYKVYVFITESYEFLSGQEGFLKNVIFIFSALLMVVLLCNSISIFRMRRKQIAEFAKFIMREVPEERGTRWEKIKKYLDSDNVSDWRWAILEADSLLEDIVAKMGYEGETFGERLSKIKRVQFKSLDDLWRAHKVRNRIAHRGGESEFAKEEAEKTLELYEKALKELGYL